MSEPATGVPSPDMEDLRAHIDAAMGSHGQKWLRFVIKIVRNKEDAEDVLQEAVQRVLSRNRSFASAHEARMYLSRAISNTAIELYHIRKRERKRSLPLSDLIQASGSLDPQAQIEDQEKIAQRTRLLHLLGEGLRHLPRAQHEALALTILQHNTISLRQAGARTGIPYSTLRHRSSKGIANLKRYLHRVQRKRSATHGPSRVQPPGPPESKESREAVGAGTSRERTSFP